MMKTTILGLAVMASVLGGTAAWADDWRERGGHPWDEREGRGHRWHRHGHRRCGEHHAMPAELPGRYEWRDVQRWVPGYYQETYVQPVCTGHPRWPNCSGGGTQTVWVPGRYETRREWVWIAAAPSYGLPPAPIPMEHRAVPPPPVSGATVQIQPGFVEASLQFGVF